MVTDDREKNRQNFGLGWALSKVLLSRQGRFSPEFLYQRDGERGELELLKSKIREVFSEFCLSVRGQDGAAPG